MADIENGNNESISTKQKKGKFFDGKNRVIIILVAIIAVMVFTGGVFLTLFLTRGTNVKTQIDMNVLFHKVIEISEYASLSCPYNDIETFYKDTPIFFGLANSHSETIVKYKGNVKLGVNGRDIGIDVQGNSINITLPSIIVLSHETTDYEILMENNGFFSKITGDDYYQIVNLVKSGIEEELMNSDSPEKARANLETQLRGMLSQLPGMNEYIINIR
jgi:hypothetical protein